MLKKLVSLLVIGFFMVSPPVLAGEKALLYSTGELSETFRSIVDKLRDPKTQALPYEELAAESRYFARIAPLKYTVTEDGKLRDNAILGTKPWVFLTTPEGLYGKSLLQIYLDIGYEAEDIIRWQRDAEMVAILFRYREAITLLDIRDGGLPEDWQSHVYIPTWENIFRLFENLATEAEILPDKSDNYMPWQLFFNTPRQQRFVLSYPAAGKQRLQTTDYAMLRHGGGADWVYRSLLEDKLSIFEHFRGNGRTLNELVDPQGLHHDAGLREFVGPNRKLADLPELAVIHLGTLVMDEKMD